MWFAMFNYLVTVIRVRNELDNGGLFGVFLLTAQYLKLNYKTITCWLQGIHHKCLQISQVTSFSLVYAIPQLLGHLVDKLL